MSQEYTEVPLSGTIGTPAPWTPSQKLFLLLLLLATGTLTFVHLGSYQTLSPHEVYLAQSSREMLQTGDWLLPRFGGLPQLNKPPWGYWLAAVMGLLTGEINEWTARLPSAFSAILLVLFMGYWAYRWYGRSAGLGAALIQATSVYHLFYGREATVDMNQCLVMMTALFLAVDEPSSETRYRSWARWLTFWILLGIAWLQKLIFGPILVLMPVVLFRLVQGEIRRLIKPVHIVGILLAAAIALPWTFYFVSACPEVADLWRLETVGRVMGEMDRQPWWFFLGILNWMILPWGPLVLANFPHLIRTAWSGGSRERFLLIWPASYLVLLSFSSNKHPNYLLPALPAFSLIGGPALVGMIRWLRAFSQKPWSLPSCLFFQLLAALGGGGAAYVFLRVFPKVGSLAFASGLLLTPLGMLGVWYLCKGRLQHAGAALLAVYVAGFGVYAAWLQPSLDSKKAANDFARRLHEHLPQGREVCAFALNKHAACFYVQGPVERVEEPLFVKSRLSQEGELYVWTTESQVPVLMEYGTCLPLDCVSAEQRKRYPKTDPFVLIKVIRKEE